MIYLLLILAFSLFFFLPVKFKFILIKKISDLYIKLEIDSYLSNILLEIPEMKFTIKSHIPILSFEYKVGSKSTTKAKTKKVVISPLRDSFRRMIDSVRFSLTYFRTFKKLITMLLNKTNLVYLNIDVSFGSDNPALTGLLAGYIWSIIFQSLGFLSLYLNFEGTKLRTDVRPDFFKHKAFQIQVCCIFHLRVGYIIIASFITAWYLLLYKIKSVTKKYQYN